MDVSTDHTAAAVKEALRICVIAKVSEDQDHAVMNCGLPAKSASATVRAACADLIAGSIVSMVHPAEHDEAITAIAARIRHHVELLREQRLRDRAMKAEAAR